MGQGRNYNNPAENDEDEKTSKIKKVTITEEESHHAESNADESVPTPQSGDKPVSEREPEEDTATTDDDRYRASSG